MASSSYYYRQYCNYKNQVKDLKNKRSELENIEKEFGRNPVSGDPNDYNKKINNALGYHTKAFSGDNAFNAMYSALEAMKEPEVLGDSDLNAAHRAIQAEIRSLNNQISEAQRKQDQAYRNYQNAKYQEKVAADNARQC
jgi:hypothetical protein